MMPTKKSFLSLFFASHGLDYFIWDATSLRIMSTSCTHGKNLKLNLHLRHNRKSLLFLFFFFSRFFSIHCLLTARNIEAKKVTIINSSIKKKREENNCIRHTHLLCRFACHISLPSLYFDMKQSR